MSPPVLRPQAYVLAVHDLEGSAAYFRDTLGFADEWAIEGQWRALVLGEVRVMLGLCPDALAPAQLGDHAYFAYLATADVDALHAGFASRGAIVVFPPVDRPWGWREMAVATPEGHRMMFAQAI